MGKSDNIKRAKRLREAKLKREQEMLSNSGQGPASKAMMNKYESSGSKVLMNQNKIKYSELIKSFIEPLLYDDDTIQDIKSKLQFGIVVWNAAIFKNAGNSEYESIRNKILEFLPNDLDFENSFEQLIESKNELFSEYNNIIVDFEIKKMKGLDYDLSVVSVPLKK